MAAVVAVAVALVLPWAALASNDAHFGAQWSLARISAPAAWSATTGSGVTIGIVDTGVDLSHEDLAGKVVAQTSCIGSAGDPARCAGSGQDDNGHGTHVAGIAAATKDNGRGIAGVAPDARLVVAKALDSAGSGNLEDVTAGIKWVVDHGAKVVNLSLGDPLFLVTSLLGTSLEGGLDYAWAHGAVPVLASGNSNLLGLGIGSSQYGDIKAIVVGATGPDDEVAAYSSPTGSATWSIVAPGGAANGNEADDVISTFWRAGQTNQYAFKAGTSMAAPHVTGAVALLMSQGYTQQAAVNRILTTADSRVSCGSGSPSCPGRLDVGRAVTGGRSAPTPPTAPPAPQGPLDILRQLLP